MELQFKNSLQKINILKEMVAMIKDDLTDKDMMKIFINYTQK